MDGRENFGGQHDSIPLGRKGTRNWQVLRIHRETLFIANSQTNNRALTFCKHIFMRHRK
jgi:hypothetical protein